MKTNNGKPQLTNNATMTGTAAGWRLLAATVAVAGLSFGLPNGLSGEVREFTWDTFNGEWNVSANWDGPSGAFPSQVGDIATIQFSGTTNRFIDLQGDRTLTELNIGAGNAEIFFSGNTAPRLIFEAPVDDVAQINTLAMTGVVNFRTVEAVSDIVVTATHGRLNFGGGGTRPSLRGVGDVYFRGIGGVSEIGGNGITTSQIYSGNIVVDQGGVLEVTAAVAAHTGATFTVGNTGTLGGTSVINRATTIQSGGTLAPGGSAGILSFGEGLQLDANSTFEFELFGNSTADRGVLYDGVNITGGALAIDPGAIFDIVVNGTGSAVDFTDSFWQANQSWLIFSGVMEPDVSGDIFTLGTISLDSEGQDFSVTGGSFSWNQTANDVYLVYTIPEPTTVGLFAGLAVLVGVVVLRRKSSRQTGS